MRNLILVLILCLGTLPGFSQDWLTNFEEAKEKASKENKTIVMVFQGSDWCAPCIKLSREIWETETFKEYAGDHYVMVQVDFPRQKKNALSEEQQAQNDALAEQYNQNGIFPLVVVLDAQGTVIGETGYEKSTPEKYIELINSYQAR
jgi:thioredoxin-related protein